MLLSLLLLYTNTGAYLHRGSMNAPLQTVRANKNTRIQENMLRYIIYIIYIYTSNIHLYIRIMYAVHATYMCK